MELCFIFGGTIGVGRFYLVAGWWVLGKCGLVVVLGSGIRMDLRMEVSRLEGVTTDRNFWLPNLVRLRPRFFSSSTTYFLDFSLSTA